ncbi:MAG TPA: hypothetical protein VFQ62_11000 [Methylomirabilota bacterium]|jgi:hypothetical protein|nr:hypothetical protein [Methylomirabilota bacterium]
MMTNVVIRTDVRERFRAVLARAEAKLEQQERELLRRLTLERVREKRLEKGAKRSARLIVKPRGSADGDDDAA